MKVYEYKGDDAGMFVLADPRLSYKVSGVKSGKRIDQMPANPAEGFATFYAGPYTIPGMGSGVRGDSDLMHAALLSAGDVRKVHKGRVRQSYPVVVPLADAREWTRLKTLVRARAKARKIK